MSLSTPDCYIRRLNETTFDQLSKRVGIVRYTIYVRVFRRHLEAIYVIATNGYPPYSAPPRDSQILLRLNWEMAHRFLECIKGVSCSGLQPHYGMNGCLKSRVYSASESQDIPVEKTQFT